MRTRVRSGDPDAYAELFDSHARTLYNHAFRMTGDWAAAEDVMSAAFLEAWRLRGTIDPEGGSLRPWLLGIATNLARNHCRSNRRYRAAAAATAAAGAASVPDHAEEVAGRLDDRRQIAATLGQLSALRGPEREVLLLCLGEGLEYAEAARVLGIPVGTVRSRLSRARTKLRRLAEAELKKKRRELAARPRQIQGDRTNAVRSAQEGTR
ncbi:MULTISPECIES: RNA polymerase sigma factor [Streptomyces]|uniref:Siderophore-interacting protein n=1 Tax=Streptomyces spororaveus TaxID=284039 RepID=A0ABQ3TBL4_9ACTN|nr:MULTISPECIES: RNA polymerase sigma factor [Streptomyces]MCM9081775.1 RNA polymerase sigma factor [Streptomyces spororaveus]MCX5303796.1 RNA polymerase sigma factor [Streptomyces sp. NBC_00160]GHI77808.1 siderophore-interacting protein [Streptomyces spororaveus]